MLRAALVGSLIGTPVGIFLIAPQVSGLHIKVLFAVIWTLAVVGISIKAIVGTQVLRTPSLILYLVMGWAVLPVIGDLVELLSPAAIGWMLAGGIAYTVGTFFFVAEKIPYGHLVWHLFVVAGTLSHTVAMFHLEPVT